MASSLILMLLGHAVLGIGGYLIASGMARANASKQLFGLCFAVAGGAWAGAFHMSGGASHGRLLALAVALAIFPFIYEWRRIARSIVLTWILARAMIRPH